MYFFCFRGVKPDLKDVGALGTDISEVPSPLTGNAREGDENSVRSAGEYCSGEE